MEACRTRSQSRCLIALEALVSSSHLHTFRVVRGGRVFETGHTLVLGWAASRLDLYTLAGSLQQLCLSYRERGPRTIVVLTSRPKKELEEALKEAIPEAER